MIAPSFGRKSAATIAASIISYFASSAIASACTTNDIHVKSWNWRVESGEGVYVGEIVNGCSEPTGVQLQIISRDASGQAVDADDFWPAMINNIPAGDSYVFKRVSEWNPQGKSVYLKILAVKQW